MNTLRYAMLCCLLSVPLQAGENTESSGPGDLVQFRFVTKPGDVTRTQITTKTYGSMNMFGAMLTQKFSQHFEQDVVMKCLEVRPDQTSVLEMTLPAVAMRLNMGGVNIEIDTREEAPAAATQPVLDMLQRVFTSLTKIKCTVTFSPQGEPLKVEGLNEGMKTILDDLSSELGPGLKQFFDQFRDYLADDIMQEQMRSGFRILPDGGQARVGDKWTREWQVKMPPFNVMTRGQGEYEFLGMEEFRGRRCAKIRVKSTLTTVPGQKPDLSSLSNAPKAMFERMQFSMTASGGNGVAYVDPACGDILQMRETQRTTLEISMEPDPNATGEELKAGLGRITQKMTTSVQMELVEKNGEALPK